MANRILISVQDGIEKPEWLDGVEPFVQTVMEKLSYDKEEISVLFCSNEFIQELNKNYRHIDSATDVLSFENGEEYEDEEGVCRQWSKESAERSSCTPCGQVCADKHAQC